MFLRYRFRAILSALTVMALLFSGLFFCRFDAAAQTAGISGADEVLPFRPGESQIYELRWGVIPAGSAELEVMPATNLDGVPVWHFKLSVRTNEFVDVFYKVRDKIEAFADLSLRESLLYRKSQQEGRHLREEEVRFDREKDSVTYSNHGVAALPISMMAETIDPLTAVFFIRGQPLREGLKIVRPITDGKKNVIGVAQVLAREGLEVDGVHYDTFRVEPDLRGVGGVFEKSAKSRITLWFTADTRHLLVKVEGKVVVGSFTATLSNVSGGVGIPTRD